MAVGARQIIILHVRSDRQRLEAGSLGMRGLLCGKRIRIHFYGFAGYVSRPEQCGFDAH